MFNQSGLIAKIALLLSVVAGCIVAIALLPQAIEPATPPLPTRMVIPTFASTNVPVIAETFADEPDSASPAASPIPPTALPLENTPVESVAAAEVAIEPTLVPTPEQEIPTANPVIEAPDEQKIPNQITVQFKPNTTPDEQAAYIRQIGGTLKQSIPQLNAVVVNIPNRLSAQQIPESPFVVETQPDYIVSAQVTVPNDPYYSFQWSLPVMNVPSALVLLPNNTPAVIVAVLDSGICASHPDLVGRIVPGYDYVENDFTPQDEFGHGCEVAGIIAANANNATGITGVAPNTQIMPIRVLDENGNGSYSNLAAGMIYAADRGARIINLSLGGTVAASLLENALNYAVARGVLVIVSAGNTNGGPVLYPAAYPAAIAVGSVDQSLLRSNFSAVGPEIDIWAPGSNILTTIKSGTYGYASGTSFSAPNVAGIAALDIAFNKQLVLNGGIVSVTLPTNIPVPLAPANNGKINTTLTGSHVTFTWNTTAVFGATRYELQIAPDGVGIDGVPLIEVPAPANNYSQWLEFGTYQWRVRSVNVEGESSLWSAIQIITIATPINAPPLLNVFTTDKPTFTWASVSWATSYRVEISASNLFTNALAFSQMVDSTTLSVMSSSLDQGQYYWRICAVAGNKTACSTAEAFYIDLSG